MRQGPITHFSRTGLLLASLLLTTPVRADGLKPFPLFNRGDPKIDTQIFLRALDLDVRDKRIAIYPFDVSVKAQPDLPLFGSALEQALYQEGSAAVVEYLPAAPWQTLLSPHGEGLTIREREDLALADARTRTAEVHDGRVLWYGRKRADRIRRFPIEDCFLNLAWSFLKDWCPRNRN